MGWIQGKGKTPTTPPGRISIKENVYVAGTLDNPHLWCSIHDTNHPMGAECPLCEAERKADEYLRVVRSKMPELGAKYVEEIEIKTKEALLKQIDDRLKVTFPPRQLGVTPPQVDAPRNFSHCRKEPIVPGPGDVFLITLCPSIPMGVALGIGAFSPMPLIARLLAFSVAAILVFVTVMVAIGSVKMVIDRKQDHAEWERDGHLPHEVAEEFRTYWLGEKLVEMGIKQSENLESLSNEAECWKISFPYMHMHMNSDPCGRCGSDRAKQDLSIALKSPTKRIDAANMPEGLEAIALKNDVREFERAVRITTVGIVASALVFSVIVPIIVHALFPH